LYHPIGGISSGLELRRGFLLEALNGAENLYLVILFSPSESLSVLK